MGPGPDMSSLMDSQITITLCVYACCFLRSPTCSLEDSACPGQVNNGLLGGHPLYDEYVSGRAWLHHQRSARRAQVSH